jgi:hypothetical protein
MIMTPWERFLLAVVIALVFIAVARLFNRVGRWWVNRTSREIGGTAHGTPGDLTLLYFWSTSCAQCKVQENQILEAQKTLADRGRTITVSKHNAVAEEELSSRMQVLTVPTTVLLRGDGTIAAWNPGLTGAHALAAQISNALDSRTEGAHGIAFSG